MADQGSASGNAELALASSTISTDAVVYLEVHTPTGNNNASALNPVPGGVRQGHSIKAYGTTVDGSAVSPTFIQNFGSLGLFTFHNPA